MRSRPWSKETTWKKKEKQRENFIHGSSLKEMPARSGKTCKIPQTTKSSRLTFEGISISFHPNLYTMSGRTTIEDGLFCSDAVSMLLYFLFCYYYYVKGSLWNGQFVTGTRST